MRHLNKCFFDPSDTDTDTDTDIDTDTDTDTTAAPWSRTAVIDGDGRLVGLVDAADIVLSDGGSGTIISDVMNAQVATAQASQPAAFAFTLYRRLGQRHAQLPRPGGRGRGARLLRLPPPAGSR